MQPHERGSATSGNDASETQAASVATAESPARVASSESVSSGHTPVNARSGTGAWLGVLALLFIAGLATAYVLITHRRQAADSELQSAAKTESEAPMTVDVVKVQYAPATRVLALPGETRAWYETTIYARVSGYLKKWNVDIGDSVKEGQVLATIETPELDQQLAAAQSKVEAEKAQVNLAEANVHFSEVTLARFKDAPKGIVSDLERDEKEADYQTSQAKLAAARSDLNSAQSEVDRLNAMISFKKVTAPFDGVITQRHVDMGDLVTAGSTSNTSPLFVLRQNNQIRVFVNVPEAMVPDLHDGDQAIAVAEEFPGREFVGRVARNSRAINESSKTLKVEVDIPNDNMLLLPGMFVNVNFQIKEPQPPLVIPASAIAFRAGGPQVAVVDKNGRVTFQKVAISRDMGDTIELQNGVKADDNVALNISSQVASGDVVKFNEVQQAEAPIQPEPKSLSANVSAASR